MLYLKKWYAAPPEARPLHVLCHGLVKPVHLGIKASQPPPGPGKKY
ncbi:hypothetical protein Enr17x_03890 [Gimesia fumaroli]|uniref:Uncharacterized protein n=1 Tax=Gimesia fumaroli TaxID=2527976 RepID=A0A518I5L6_9PLAN|nr:hypothetical protein Enr17x_03890 [Gimesia fumaroli]